MTGVGIAAGRAAGRDIDCCPEVWRTADFFTAFRGAALFVAAFVTDLRDDDFFADDFFTDLLADFFALFLATFFLQPLFWLLSLRFSLLTS